jgi:copper(I)-binding protein
VGGVLAIALVVGCLAEQSSDRQPLALVAGLEIYDACAPAPAAPDVGSLYFTVVNVGSEPDTLLAIETSAGGRATLHEMVSEDGVMRMQATGPIAIPTRDTLRLRPGGYHVMLSDLPHRPAVGDTLAVVLSFARRGTIEFAAPVLTYTEVVRLLGEPGGTKH